MTNDLTVVVMALMVMVLGGPAAGLQFKSARVMEKFRFYSVSVLLMSWLYIRCNRDDMC